MLDTTELVDRACWRIDCKTMASQATHRQLIVGGIPIGLHWSNSIAARDIEVLVDIGPVDSPLRETVLESFLCANLAFYPEGRNMLALDPESRHVIFATRIDVDQHTTELDVAREVEAAAATGAAVRREIAGAQSALEPATAGETNP